MTDEIYQVNGILHPQKPSITKLSFEKFSNTFIHVYMCFYKSLNVKGKNLILNNYNETFLCLFHFCNYYTGTGVKVGVCASSKVFLDVFLAQFLNACEIAIQAMKNLCSAWCNMLDW